MGSVTCGLHEVSASPLHHTHRLPHCLLVTLLLELCSIIVPNLQGHRYQQIKCRMLVGQIRVDQASRVGSAAASQYRHAATKPQVGGVRLCCCVALQPTTVLRCCIVKPDCLILILHIRSADTAHTLRACFYTMSSAAADQYTKTARMHAPCAPES